MKQIFVAAWVGIAVGWLGFGWVLAEAPAEGGAVMAQVEDIQPLGLAAASIDILQEPEVAQRVMAKEPTRTEPNLRG